LGKDFKGTSACGCALLPFKTKISGSGVTAINDESKEDIIDDALKHFKANTLFKSFDIKNDTDRTLIYLMFYIQLCLSKIRDKKCPDMATADKLLFQQAQEKFQAPGEPGFVLGGFFPAAKSSTEANAWLAYFKVIRQECGLRVLKKIFPDEKKPPNKYWMQFSKRKFMNKELTK